MLPRAVVVSGVVSLLGMILTVAVSKVSARYGLTTAQQDFVTAVFFVGYILGNALGFGLYWWLSRRRA